MYGADAHPPKNHNQAPLIIFLKQTELEIMFPVSTRTPRVKVSFLVLVFEKVKTCIKNGQYI